PRSGSDGRGGKVATASSRRRERAPYGAGHWGWGGIGGVDEPLSLLSVPISAEGGQGTLWRLCQGLFGGLRRRRSSADAAPPGAIGPRARAHRGESGRSANGESGRRVGRASRKRAPASPSRRAQRRRLP